MDFSSLPWGWIILGILVIWGIINGLGGGGKSSELIDIRDTLERIAEKLDSIERTLERVPTAVWQERDHYEKKKLRDILDE